MNRINRYRLDNGLRLVHSRDTSTPDVALNITYDVGSRDEDPTLTGIAHLFEHLMFGGSQNIPDFDRYLENAGGSSNAWTSADFTNFYDVLPAINAETAFWLESDRMNALLFSEEVLETQRSVVIEEFKQTSLNQPYGDISHILYPMLYHSHPYSTPVIGKEISHIEKITNDHIKDFFYSHYGPNNAVIAVTGNIDFDKTVKLTKKYFGDIPAISLKQRSLPIEPAIISPRRLTVYRRVPYPQITIAFLMTGRDSMDSLEYEATDIISDILALGRASRFYRNLIITGLLSFADASISGTRDQGFISITARMNENSDQVIAEAERLLWSEIHSLTENGISAFELQKAVNKLLTRLAYNEIGFLKKARSLAINEISGLDNNILIERYKALTPEYVKEIARKLLKKDKSVTLIYRPENAE